jgi:hypothetical protein
VSLPAGATVVSGPRNDGVPHEVAWIGGFRAQVYAAAPAPAGKIPRPPMPVGTASPE